MVSPLGLSSIDFLSKPATAGSASNAGGAGVAGGAQASTAGSVTRPAGQANLAGSPESIIFTLLQTMLQLLMSTLTGSSAGGAGSPPMPSTGVAARPANSQQPLGQPSLFGAGPSLGGQQPPGSGLSQIGSLPGGIPVLGASGSPVGLNGGLSNGRPASLVPNGMGQGVLSPASLGSASSGGITNSLVPPNPSSARPANLGQPGGLVGSAGNSFGDGQLIPLDLNGSPQSIEAFGLPILIGSGAPISSIQPLSIQPGSSPFLPVPFPVQPQQPPQPQLLPFPVPFPVQQPQQPPQPQLLPFPVPFPVQQPQQAPQPQLLPFPVPFPVQQPQQPPQPQLLPFPVPFPVQQPQQPPQPQLLPIPYPLPQPPAPAPSPKILPYPLPIPYGMDKAPSLPSMPSIPSYPGIPAVPYQTAIPNGVGQFF